MADEREGGICFLCSRNGPPPRILPSWTFPWDKADEDDQPTTERTLDMAATAIVEAVETQKEMDQW